MNKKGLSLERNLIILLILGILVIVIFSFFFKSKITEGSERYSEISEQLDNCESFMSKNKCTLKSECPSRNVINPIGSKGWADCKEDEVCCEV